MYVTCGDTETNMENDATSHVVPVKLLAAKAS